MRREDFDPVDTSAYDLWWEELASLQSAFEAASDRVAAARYAVSQLPPLEQLRAEYSARLGRAKALREEGDRLAGTLIPLAVEEERAARNEVAGIEPRLAEYRAARDAATARLLGLVPADLPLVLLPVRLETRFSQRAGRPELLVRVYPDTVHIDGHEPGLTADERSWGQEYWAQARAPGAVEGGVAAWRRLVDRFGAERGAWIARVTDPSYGGAVAARDASWTRAPETAVLPDRWVAVGYVAGRPVLAAWGDPATPDPLPVGPAPKPTAGPGATENPLADDPGLAWMIDFDVAVRAGMGLRIPLTAEQAGAGFDRLIVLGVKAFLQGDEKQAWAEKDADEARSRLATVLDAQHYTRGLAFVPAGTPTNNTSEAASGFSTAAPDAGESHRVERGGPLVRVGDGLDGTLAARALGLDATTFEHVRHADGAEQRDARHLATVLWPLLQSPLLDELAGAWPVGDLRGHFIDYVRARGPLPTLRVGSQPYGLLPVTTLERWASRSGGDVETAQVGRLRALLAAWGPFIAAVPAVTRGADLATVLGPDAAACRYLAQGLREGRPAGGAPAEIAHDAAPADPAGGVPDEQAFLKWLSEAAADIATVEREAYPAWSAGAPARPHPLLYLLARDAVLRVLGPAGPGDAERKAFTESLAYLAGRPSSDLRAALSGALDLATYRLDAWATSVATWRLAQVRQVRPTGIGLGGYGWVEELRPGPPRREVTPRPGEPGPPLYERDDNKGYVHAPSLPQAATAAVLRSGYLAHRATGRGAALAVDLSSERVRRAQWLLDGVRGGQSLGALLGYRFERALHENQLDHLIAPLRTLAALKDEDELVLAMREADEARRASDAITRQVDELQAKLLTLGEVLKKLGQRKTEAAGPNVALQADRAGLTTRKTALDAAVAAIADLAQRITAHRGTLPRIRVAKYQDVDVQEPSDGDFAAWEATLTSLNAQRTAAIGERDRLRGELDQMLASRPATYQQALEALDAAIARIDAEVRRFEAEEALLTNEATALDGQLRAMLPMRDDLDRRKVGAVRRLQDLLQQQWKKASESVAANNVVDGFELYRRWRAGNAPSPARWDATTIPFGLLGSGLPPADPTRREFAGLVEQLGALDELVDAVGDATLAEGVHQLVQGNPTRSGATTDAIARGEAAPPELEVVRTPRTGIGVTHRIVALFPAETAPPPPTEVDRVRAEDALPAGARAAAVGLVDRAEHGMAPTPFGGRATGDLARRLDPRKPPPAPTAAPPSVRAAAEPALNKWIAQFLGSAANVCCRAALVDPQSSSILLASELRLNVLRLAPIDLLYLAESTGQAERSELEQRLIYHWLRSQPAPVRDDLEVRLDFGRDPAWPPTLVSVGEFLLAVRSARRLVTGARPVGAADLATAAEKPAPGLDLQDLSRRTDAAVKSLREARAALRAAAAAPPSADPQPIRDALLRMASFGFFGAIPTAPVKGTPAAVAALLGQAGSVDAEAVRRLAEIERLDQGFASDDAGAIRDHHVRRMRHVFGEDFAVLPILTAPNAAVLDQAFADDQLVGSDAAAVPTWFQRVSRVREGAGRLDAAIAHAETLDSGATLSLRVGQLPYAPGDRWTGMPATPGRPFGAGRISIAAHVPAGFRFSRPLVGLLVDEWVEVVPNPNEVTGLTFHFNQPDAQAPQAILVAAGPVLQRGADPAPWDLDTLGSVLSETLDLARVRAVTPDDRSEEPWVEGSLPPGARAAGTGEGWEWARADPTPLSAAAAHRSAFSMETHQHFFEGATAQLRLGKGDRLFAYVHLDPQAPPEQVMLQWNDGTWEHRAFWGADRIAWGVPGTASRRAMGPLPAAGRWARLEVPAAAVGLEGRAVHGMAFTLFGGRATWDRAGKSPGPLPPLNAPGLPLPALFLPGDPTYYARAARPGRPS